MDDKSHRSSSQTLDEGDGGIGLDGKRMWLASTAAAAPQTSPRDANQPWLLYTGRPAATRFRRTGPCKSTCIILIKLPTPMDLAERWYHDTTPPPSLEVTPASGEHLDSNE
jgi:hypothetical protein